MFSSLPSFKTWILSVNLQKNPFPVVISFAESVSISSEIRVGMKMLTLRIKSFESSVHSQIMSTWFISQSWKLLLAVHLDFRFTLNRNLWIPHLLAFIKLNWKVIPKTMIRIICIEAKIHQIREMTGCQFSIYYLCLRPLLEISTHER